MQVWKSFHGFGSQTMKQAHQTGPKITQPLSETLGATVPSPPASAGGVPRHADLLHAAHGEEAPHAAVELVDGRDFQAARPGTSQFRRYTFGCTCVCKSVLATFGGISLCLLHTALSSRKRVARQTTHCLCTRVRASPRALASGLVCRVQNLQNRSDCNCHTLKSY